MVEIPDHEIARTAISLAREIGDLDSVNDTAYEGRWGEAQFDTDWSLSDLDPAACEVEYVGEHTVSVRGKVPATYSVQVAKATRRQPAEYERQTVSLGIEIMLNLNGLPDVEVGGEIY